MADILDLSKLDEMDKRDIILRCLGENWPVEVSMLGKDLVTRIVDDALSGDRTEFRTAPGGLNFDLADYINMIIHGASLLVFIWHTYTMLPKSSPGDTPGDTPDRTEPDRNEEDLVRSIVEILITEKNVEPVMATQLTRLFLRVLSFRASNNGH